ncbi:sigma factor-like helix-turn-helix DNA-binding protein [Streptosporangium sp. NBC_01756]|uniref:sigma factor-like helix-turn-helix DNA-binding protein n=1 Tax=Streptosporangium sp. NBC_01756 TaxID=2975950 RepID=UPI002DD835D3|nr:sigma factor-like helix-turn-helix DNA-binding protein [Streptosporangium sp. NBC_01756]WSC88644.1 hypothetical protein OIE48_10790 [Streptosporangium sp. NBC_01756]
MNAALRTVTVPAGAAVLGRLSPTERAVFVLRESFSYGFREIAGMLDLSEASCRRIHRAARRPGMRSPEPRRHRLAPLDGRHDEIVDRFLATAAQGDLDGLEPILADEVVARADGEETTLIHDRKAAARRAAGLLAGFGTRAEVERGEVNGQPALVARVDGELAGVIIMEIADGRVSALWSVLSPARLAPLR